MIDDVEKRVSRLRAASTFEEHAHDVRLSIWNRRHELFNGNVPTNPLDLLEPAVALHLEGFEVRTDPALGEMWEAGGRVRVAGIVDQRGRIVRVSPGLSDQERRFTTAHELAHVRLHPEMSGLHRDRPISGPCSRKDSRERDADSFASSFVMPAKLLIRRFRECFAMEVFRLNEDAVFGLRMGTVDQAQRHMRCPRDVSFVLARASSFMGVAFEPLSRFFRVSPTAMAIRLEEVGLVDEASARWG